ncbi:hypothetical protein MAHJHV63_54540 [Mycobacterium avium subsp. hominissuis]
MNFIDAHDFSVGLVLRVLGIAASTYYGWRKARQQPSIGTGPLTRLLAGFAPPVVGRRGDTQNP